MLWNVISSLFHSDRLLSKRRRRSWKQRKGKLPRQSSSSRWSTKSCKRHISSELWKTVQTAHVMIIHRVCLFESSNSRLIGGFEDLVLNLSVLLNLLQVWYLFPRSERPLRVLKTNQRRRIRRWVECSNRSRCGFPKMCLPFAIFCWGNPCGKRRKRWKNDERHWKRRKTLWLLGPRKSSLASIFFLILSIHFLSGERNLFFADLAFQPPVSLRRWTT